MTRLLLPAAALVSLLTTSCSPISVKAVWKDPAYAKLPRKVFVVAVLDNLTNRRLLEDSFVGTLQRHGLEAVAAYTLFGGIEPRDRELVIAKVKESGADSVLVTRVVDRRTEAHYVSRSPSSSFTGTWPSSYGNAFTTTYYSPTYRVTEDYATAETNFYDAASETLAWTISSETWLNGSARTLLQDYVAAVIDAMRNDGILK
jgi:hypothetical protein